MLNKLFIYLVLLCFQEHSSSRYAITYTNAVTASIIQAGFKLIGMYSFNIQIFSDSDFLPGYITNYDFSLSAAGEAEKTFNETPKTLVEDQLAGNNNGQENNEIAKSTAADIKQQPSTSSNAAVNPSKQGSAALSRRLLSRSKSILPQSKFVYFQKLNRATITKEKSRENKSQKS